MSTSTLTSSASATCYVCGYGQHAPTELHTFWSVADAMNEAAEHDRRVVAAGGPKLPSMSAVETLDPREAVIS